MYHNESGLIRTTTKATNNHRAEKWYIFHEKINGGFHKWGYPQSSSISMAFSIINSIYWGYPKGIKSRGAQLDSHRGHATEHAGLHRLVGHRRVTLTEMRNASGDAHRTERLFWATKIYGKILSQRNFEGEEKGCK